MTAEIHQLPRFKGDKARQVPSDGEILSYADALRLLSENAGEWFNHGARILEDGPHFTCEDGREHVMVDALAIKAMAEDMNAMAFHLARMADMLDEADEADIAAAAP